MLIASIIAIPSIGIAQNIDFTLTKIQGSVAGCRIYFDLQNNTGLNITSGRIDTTRRELDGSVISKAAFGFQRIKKGATEAVFVVDLNACGEVREVKVSIVDLAVDGNRVGEKTIFTIDNGLRKSNIKNVLLK